MIVTLLIAMHDKAEQIEIRQQIHLQVLDQQIHTNDATGRLLFHCGDLRR
jgi:hypothetical protein